MPDSRPARYSVTPFPRERWLMVDGGRIGRQKHLIHGLVEFDVTEPRAILREHKRQTGESVSFTAYVAHCLGKAVGEHKQLHAYRNWRSQLILFDDVDVNTIFAVKTTEGRDKLMPHVLRATNQRSVRDLHEEIRAFQAGHRASGEADTLGWFIRLPGPLRRALYWVILRNPPVFKSAMGTVSLTAIGMFGNGGGWGLPVPAHSLQITLGGIAEKPGVVNHHIEIREYLSVTISLDHDVVDGAPAARFTQCFKELVEQGAGLLDVVHATAEPRPLTAPGR
jgi:pyruvate/2-oxoglutarate dehydrogenase complex dihydrolipoamide acyltransferase (E2) component